MCTVLIKYDIQNEVNDVKCAFTDKEKCNQSIKSGCWMLELDLPGPAVLVGHGVLLHDCSKAQQRKLLQQTELAC